MIMMMTMMDTCIYFEQPTDLTCTLLMLTLLHFYRVFRRALRHMYIILLRVISYCYPCQRVVQSSRRAVISIITSSSSNNNDAL